MTDVSEGNGRKTAWQELVTFGEPPEPALPWAVQQLVRPDVDYTGRLAALQSLTDNLDARDVDGLITYLRTRGAREGLAGMQERLLKSAAMNLLLRQTGRADEVVRGLISVCRDRKQDVVVRTYALHYLRFMYEGAAEDLRGFIRLALWDAASEIDSNLGGSALLALQRLSETHGEIDKADLGQVALSRAEDDRCGEMARRAGLEVCMRMGLTAAAPVSARLAQTADSLGIRLAAIDALGSVGDANAIPVLQSLSLAPPDPRLESAARTALLHLTQRQATGHEVV